MVRRRYLHDAIDDLAFARGKMAFVGGPRQAGKTTLAKTFLAERGGRYATWDDVATRRIWVRDPKQLVPKAREVLALDEIHKARGWKRTIKGIYDTLDHPIDLIVTGSARLDVFRKGGDSLLGRYLHFRLHPFSLRELHDARPMPPDELVESLRTRALRARAADDSDFAALLRFGGFPEPLFAADARVARLWQRSRVEKVIREDLRDLTRIPELGRIEMLAALIPERVGSPLSVASLREDLEVSHDTTSRWLGALRELYYLFDVKPFTRSIRRSLRKEGKTYLWDWTEVDDPGARFENLVACHLLKACDFWTDTGEGRFDLHYVRDKEKREIDFLIVRDGKPMLAVEAKRADTEPSPHFRAFGRALGATFALQIVAAKNHWREHRIGDTTVLVASAAQALRYLA